MARIEPGLLGQLLLLEPGDGTRNSQSFSVVHCFLDLARFLSVPVNSVTIHKNIDQALRDDSHGFAQHVLF